MKRVFLISLLAFISIVCYSQQASIHGYIIETSEKGKISNAAISLLRAKDSVLYRSVRSDPAGKFELSGLKAGKYLLFITAQSFADYVEPLELTDSTHINFDNLALTGRAKLLQAVIVRQANATMRRKGDTTEFMADSFKVQPNATVEDLLKKLPGMQVDKNGAITVEGEAVKKVLVDGEEFFGDDPTLVTKNLRADYVDKVQVYDKKSDQANFTGIDDGKREKTINLKIKENKKNGYFGKLSAGTGTEGYQDDQAMFNYFKGRQKFAAYGIISNTGTFGLNWQDQDTYGGGYSGDETGSQRGLPMARTGGLHYNDKWAGDKQSINGNYKILQLNTDGNSGTVSQYILPDTSYFTSSRETFSNKSLSQKINGNYSWDIDTTATLKLYANGEITHKNNNSIYHSESSGQNQMLINQNDRDNSSTGDMASMNSTLNWMKKLHKKGRTIMLYMNQQFNKNTSSGYLLSTTGFYQGGQLDSTQHIDQYKTSQSVNTNLETKLSYTEPLSRLSAISLQYGVAYHKGTSYNNSFNKGIDAKYSLMDSLYSNDYELTTFANRATAGYNYNGKKTRFNAGTGAELTNQEQHNRYSNQVMQRQYINWFPNAWLVYLFTSQRRLYFNYNGTTNQPSIDQLQPLLTNQDPLNVVIGNPSLKPAFKNDFRINFSDFKVLSARSIWLNGDYSFTQNFIGTRSTVDEVTGKRTSQSVNLNGVNALNIYANTGGKIKKLDLGFYIYASGSLNTSKNFVNSLLNTTHSGNYTIGESLSKSKDKSYDAYINASATYTDSRSSIQPTTNVHYWTYEIRPNLDIFLPRKYQLHSDISFSIRQQTALFSDNNNVSIWNAWAGKKLLKNDALLIKVSVNDILDQNRGFTRQVQTNQISENTFTTIRRYGMLSVVWNFTHSIESSSH